MREPNCEGAAAMFYDQLLETIPRLIVVTRHPSHVGTHRLGEAPFLRVVLTFCEGRGLDGVWRVPDQQTGANGLPRGMSSPAERIKARGGLGSRIWLWNSVGRGRHGSRPL